MCRRHDLLGGCLIDAGDRDVERYRQGEAAAIGGRQAAGRIHLDIIIADLLVLIAGHMDHGIAEAGRIRSEEHTSELQSLMRISYSVFCLQKKTQLITSKSSARTIT